MSVSPAQRLAVVALIGNPNTGKSTLFNALSGARQRVGNFPGCTVEKKLGTMRHGDERFQIIDLPGTYSLQPRSPDEMVAVDVLLGRRSDVAQPDAVVCIVDASNLERNLYLVSQVLEIDLPVVLALNMTDLAERRGVSIDLPALSAKLGVPVVPIQANRSTGIIELKTAIAASLTAERSAARVPFPEEFRKEVDQLAERIRPEGWEKLGLKPVPRYLVERLLLDTSGYLAGVIQAPQGVNLEAELTAARQRLREARSPIPAVEAAARYRWIGEQLAGVVQKTESPRIARSDSIDRILTHRVYGVIIFAAIMFTLFFSVFSIATYPMDWIDGGIGSLGESVSEMMSPGPLRSLVVDGIIGGVGSVVIFLPQIIILFFFLAILEDCGYLARAAYLMDKLLCRVGLSGKSFIPMLSSFACAIPGIMATRTIEHRRDRLTTILVAPLMSCSARLPVYILLTTAFIPGVWMQSLVMFSMYLLGIVVAAGVAFVLKRTLLRGSPPPFVMELPTYKMPSVRMVAWRMAERGWAFLRRAGTLIFAVSIIIWALLYFPRADVDHDTVEGQATQVEQSILGQVGHAIAPIFEPLGWDWRISTAALASFPAREVVVAVLGTIYSLGADVDVGEQAEEEDSPLKQAIHSSTWPEGAPKAGEPVYNIPVALSIMVFFALCSQCAATLAVIKRETNSWFWPIFAFTYMTVLAYIGALITYQVGMLIVT
jgi:ferrous iron transport protein B